MARRLPPLIDVVRWTDLIDKYRTWTNYLGTVLAAWILSAIVAQMIGNFLPEATASLRPKQQPTTITSALDSRGRSRLPSYYLAICERNIFDSLKRSTCMEEAPVIEEELEDEFDLSAAPVKSNMNALLLATVVFSDLSRSFATVAKKNGKDGDNYYVGDMIMDEGKVYDIERNRVYLIRKGRREYLEVDLPGIFLNKGSAPIRTPAIEGVERRGDNIVVSRSKVESTLGDLNKIIQQARMVPNFSGGSVNGFKVFAIKSGSIFQQLGLKNGDVIHRINGTEINSVEKALPMLQLAREESSLSIDLSRRGKKKTLSIEIR